MAGTNVQQKSGTGILAQAAMAKDSAAPGIEFNADSSFSIFNTKEPAKIFGKYYLDTNIRAIFIKNNSAWLPYEIKTWTDSSLQLFSVVDNVWYTLRKK